MRSFPAVLLIACAFLLVPAGPKDQAQVQPTNPQTGEAPFLRLGQPVEREMKGGETHTYRIHVEAGQFVHVVVLQKGIDVAVSLFDPGGREVVTMDSLNGAYGPEPVSAIADVSGDFQLKIVAGEAPPGHYQAQLTDLRTPTQADRTRMDAERNYREGVELNRKGNAASYKAAVEKWKASAGLWQSLGDKYGEAISRVGIGEIYLRLGESPKALDEYAQALSLLRSTDYKERGATALNGMGDCYRTQWKNSEALDSYQRALSLAVASGDLPNQARALLGLGWVNENAGQFAKSTDFYNHALPLAQKAGDRELEGTILRRMGFARDNLGDSQAALTLANQALAVFRSIGDREGEAKTLSNIGVAFDNRGEKRKALEFYNQAIALYRELGDSRDEADDLVNIGGVYDVFGENEKALDVYNQALTFFRKSGDAYGQEITLGNIALIYRDTGKLQLALDFTQRSLSASRELGDRDGEASFLANIAAIYSDLGELGKSIDYARQASSIYSQTGHVDNQAKSLETIGYSYYQLGDSHNALHTEEQALLLFQKAGDREGQAVTTKEIGSVYFGLGEFEKALRYYDRALPVFREVGNRDREAEALIDIGDVRERIRQSERALDSYNNALSIAAAIDNPLLQAGALHALMLHERSANSGLAAFYGKQAVNALQQVRSNIQSLDKNLQRSFLSSKNGYYRDLADLLIAQGRLPEAEQVLDALKDQEYSDFVRGKESKPSDALSLTPAERQAEEDYQHSTAQLVAQGARWNELKQKGKARTDAENTEFDQLSEILKNASQGLNDYYSRLYTLFGQNSAANTQQVNVKGRVADLRDLVAKLPRTVALYTLVAEKRYNVIVITGSKQPVGRASEISEADLNRKVAAFQEVLRDPSKDPRPPAQELYRILIGPVEKDLEQAQAETMVWSLDGALRYIPMSALYDGKQYLVERYNLVTLTPAGSGHLADVPDVQKLTALAMGISRKYEDGLDPLPKVVGELEGIVKDPAVEGARGVLPGTMLLDKQFTEKALEQQLDARPAVVHIASHFHLEPGDDQQSYLLLAGKNEGGDGYHLTVAEFRNDQNLDLEGADLLTLSACQTGMSSNRASNGEEVDGLGGVAQEKGAKAVISSLWEVNDASTGELMADFYQRWVDGAGKVMKVEALRQAQLDLLQGRIKPSPDYTDPNAPSSFAHPHYWAPFILTGNWR